MFGQRYDASGSPTGPEFRVNVTEEGNQYRPSASMAPDGSFGVAFQNTNLEESSFDVKMALFDARGDNPNEYDLNVYTEDEQREPCIASAGSRGFVAVWESQGQDGDGDGVFGRRFLGPGNSDDEEFQVPGDGQGWQNFPAISAHERFAVVVWQTTGPTGDFILMARAFNLDQPQ